MRRFGLHTRTPASIRRMHSHQGRVRYVLCPLRTAVECFEKISDGHQVALQISKLCGISSDLMNYFYNPLDMDKVKGKQTELKKLSEIHQRLETWRRELPKELEPKEGGLPSMLVMQ